MSRKDPKSHETWRAALREGDPAGGEPGLLPGEIERMRHRVLAAGPEPRRRFAFAPVWASALAAAALILAVALVRTTPESPRTVAVRNPPPVRVEPAPPAARPAAPAAPEAPSVSPEPAAPRTRPAPPRAEPSRIPPPEDRVAQLTEPELSEPFIEPDPGLLEGPAADETLASVDVDDGAQPRQVQFSTPGGTRIIWMLAPEDPSTEESHE